MQIQTFQTPEALVTLTSGLPVAPEPSMETEGSATVIRIGGLEIVVDPDHREG